MTKKTKTPTTPKRQTVTTKDITALASLISFSDEDTKPEEEEQSPSSQEKRAAYSEYRNATYTIVSIVAYLIGIPKEYFGDENATNFLMKTYEELEQNKDARIIRNLCRIRAAMERNYKAIAHEFWLNIKNIGSVPDLIPTDAVETLAKDGVRLYKQRPEIDEYILAINIELSNRINTAAPLFPEWIKWEYIRPLFIMPGGTKKENIKKAGEIYNSDRLRYPFQCWINWEAVSASPESKGNILYTDEKFVRIIYERHEDRFENLSLVRNAGNHTMRNLENLLQSSKKCVVVVDCENADAVKLAAALSSLPAYQLSKIAKVLLFDSEYTTDQWSTLVDRMLHSAAAEKASFEIEHILVPRVNQNKSQCDMTLAVRTSREVYTSGVDGVILVSSDSDYWAMIQQLEGVRFLVMLEKRKTGLAIMDALTIHNIPFCFIDDFCTAASYTIKTTTLINGIQEQIQHFLSGEGGQPLNLREMMNIALQGSWITMTDKEKENFFTRYLQRAKMTVAQDGAVSITIG